MRILPDWLVHYRRAWLPHDIGAGLIVWGVVVPQAVAYAQIAGLPPSAGLVAAPAALIAYAILGSSKTLVVSATTATSALSAAAVGPLAHGDVKRFAALSAALAIVSGVMLIGAGVLRIGGVMDLVSKPVMTGFLFGLGLFVAVGAAAETARDPGSRREFLPEALGRPDPSRRHERLDARHRGRKHSVTARARSRRPEGAGNPRVAGLARSSSRASSTSAATASRSSGTSRGRFPIRRVPDVGWHDLARAARARVRRDDRHRRRDRRRPDARESGRLPASQ